MVELHGWFYVADLPLSWKLKALVGLLGVATGTCILVAAARPARQGVRRPNVILISIDTLRADHLGCYGYDADTTPGIDAFRRESVLFRNVIASAPSTLPSHASMLTSLAPQHHGASHSASKPLASEVVTVTEVLRDAGYRTAAFVGGGQLAPEFGLNQGFESYEVIDDGTLSQVGARALPFLEEVRDRPFFLVLHSYQVHHPYSPSIDRLARIEPALESAIPTYLGLELIDQINSGKMQIDAVDRKHIVDLYDSEISEMDDGFIALIADLKRLGLYDNSIIVFTSDHGEEFGEHGFMAWHSHTLYDELLHVPLLVRFPSAKYATREIGGVVRSVDIAPMILESAGIPRPRQFRDFRLAETMKRGTGIDAPTLLWMESPPGDTARHDGFRTAEWKLIGDRLYDLRNDPRETTDVATSFPAIAHDLTEKMNALIRDRAAPGVTATVPEPETIQRLRSLGYVK